MHSHSYLINVVLLNFELFTFIYLSDCQGTAKVQGISFNTLEARELDMSPSAFEKMYNLRVLQICDTKYIYDDKYCKLYLSQGLEFLPSTLSLLRWDGYPLKSLPSKFSPENLVELRMPYSKVEQLWTKEQVYMVILILE